jgi:zinc protease
MLVKGTKTRKEEDIEPVLNSLGGSIGGFSGKNSIGVNFQVLSLNQDKAWDIFEDVVKDPAFPDKELAIVKERILSAIKESSKSPSYEANRLLLKSLYGSHPYSMSEMGVALSVEPVTKADLQAFHYRYFNPQNAVMVVVGDIDLEVMAKRAEKMFGAWKAGDGKFESRPVDGIDGIKNAEITMDKEEAIVIVGYQGVTVYDPRKYPLAVISGILSGGGGLMFKVIREDNGLSYSCGAQATVSMDKGYFTLSAHTSEASVPKVEELIKKLAERIRRGDFKDEDIEGAKNRAITAYVSTFESIGELAKTLALVEFSGLGYKEFREYPENIRKVTKEDITRCAGELLDPTKCVIVVVHSSKKDVPK